MANCLLVGGGGFFGGHLTKRLLELGHKVVILDCKRFLASVQAQMGMDWPEQPGGAALKADGEFNTEYWQIDVTDPVIWTEMNDMLAEIDVVYMLVGLLGSVPCTENMTAAVQRNVLPMALLIDRLVQIGATPDIVYPSSDLVYGLNSGSISECDATKPICGYSVTKLASEGLLRVTQRAYGIRSVILRTSTTYGPFQQRNSLVNFYVRRALEDGLLPVYGNGSAARDWLYIDDAVAALLMPLDWPSMSGVFNVPGDQRTIREVAHTVVSRLGMGKVEYVPWPDLTGRVDVASHVLAGDRLHNGGWYVDVGLEEGIKRTAEWMKGQRCTK